MTTDQPVSNRLILGLDETKFGIKLKSQKLLVGPFELGLSACYMLSEPEERDAQQALISIERFKPSLSVKDVYLRGKFELEPATRRLHYSKKFRLPYLDSELLKLRLTAQVPAPEASGGVLGRALGLMVTFHSERLHNSSVVRKAPEYALQLSPRVGPPQQVCDSVGFPGSIYFKAKTTLHVSDSASFSGVRARLDVHSLNAVIRLYDPIAVKPCRIGRNLARVARHLTVEEVEDLGPAAEEAGPVVQPVQPDPDVIDKLAATSREWAHAVLVNSCVATRNLQHKATQAVTHLRSYVSDIITGGSGNGSTERSDGTIGSSTPSK
ncbi:hypothetical protein Vretimale_12442 [Volvox reticuliferus]|uniref:Uncharacterized protein n=1 Tax=Volvox reticuliferus TaxID=1737510 RepID=A0A8J4LSK7_9CHLO|nr:hypothetical protein Vretifemale_9019 [Volvox reticuliferus]GIM08466.1 hypothetical protein Vretimale_12442 [Volvox reticuliferus]